MAAFTGHRKSLFRERSVHYRNGLFNVSQQGRAGLMDSICCPPGRRGRGARVIKSPYFCITQRKASCTIQLEAQRPSRTCNEGQEEEEESTAISLTVYSTSLDRGAPGCLTAFTGRRARSPGQSKVGLFLGPYAGPKEVGVSYERGTPVPSMHKPCTESTVVDQGTP